MFTKQIRLLIADDDREICRVLADFFEMQPFIEVCGIAHDGVQTLEMIYRHMPDVALVDIVMPDKDGIWVLEELREKPAEKRPLIIITSASGQEIVMRKAVALGADFFIMKPYSLNVLLSRVKMVAGMDADLKENNNEAADTKKSVVKYVLHMCVPTQLLGYQYIISALNILMLQPKPYSISKNVYDNIAAEFGTTRDCVERAIRQALRKTFDSNSELMLKIMEYGNLKTDKCPSNGRFLTLAAAYIKIEENI